MSAEELRALSADARAVIELAREVYEPSELERARVLGALDGRLAASTPAWGLALAAKALPVAVLLTLLVAVAWYSAGRSLAGTTAQTPPQPAPVAPMLSVAAPQGDPVTSAAPLARSASSANQPARAAAARVRRVLVVDPPAPPQSTLVAEVSVLRAAQVALDQGQSSKALELLSEYDRRFDAGVLREERQAAEVFALCRARDAPAARRAAETFLETFPRSPLTLRVQSSCVAAAARKD